VSEQEKLLADERMAVLLATSRLNSKISASFEACTGSSIARFTILYALSDSPSLSQTELRAILGINASAVTRHLQLLEDRGLIRRNRNAEDQRNVAVSITETGSALITECSNKRELFLSSLFDDMNSTEIETLLKAVSTIESHLDQATAAYRNPNPDNTTSISIHEKEILR
jgi:DNA-binding MarR family transcriptional regulator